ncbi:MAG: L-histidine N(alpha)-methyltransferase [Candidatus Dojkabacteria bacterium]
MKYYKNVEVAEMYKVSEKTVTNWVEYAIEGKVNLELFTTSKRKYIINSPSNHSLLKTLVEKGKKYKSKRFLKKVTPLPEFYKIFNEKQVIDIITNLELYREIPLKYAYFDGGVQEWVKTIEYLMYHNTPNTTSNTVESLQANYSYILALIGDKKKVNIVDIGPGHPVVIKDFIQKLIENNKINKYIALDYSQGIIKYTQERFSDWYPELSFESHILDINYEPFQDVLFKNSMFASNSTSCFNLLLYFGSTPENQRIYSQSFQVIKDSMGKDDLFVLGQRLDTPSARYKSFSYVDSKISKSEELDRLKIVVDLLGIHEDYYDIDKIFDEKQRSRLLSIVLNTDIQISFSAKGVFKPISIPKKDKLLLFRHHHHTFAEVIDTLDKTGFDVLHASRSIDQEHIFVISRVKNPDSRYFVG